MLEWSWTARAQPRPMPQTAARLDSSAGAKKGAQCTQRLLQVQHPEQACLCSFRKDFARGRLLDAVTPGFEARSLRALVVRPLRCGLGFIHPAQRLSGIEAALAGGPAVAFVTVLRLLL